jgi:IS1 family transposase
MCGPAPEQLDRAAQREIRELREQPGRSRRIDRGPQRTSCLSDTNQQVRAHVRVYAPFRVQRFTPLLADAARPCRHAVGDRWQVDETYVKVAGQWRYVYRAVDQFGQVIDVFVSRRRDATAAHRFFQRAIGATKVNPVEVTTDKAPVYPAVLEELLPARRVHKCVHAARRYS